MRYALSGFCLTVIMAVSGVGFAAAAQVASPPSLKPNMIAASDVISTREAGILRAALSDIEDENWSKVAAGEKQLQDATARDILTWYRARRDWRISFDDVDTALTRLSSWPEIDEIRSQAEAKIEFSALNAAQRMEWFESHGGARGGAGHLTLAQAYESVGMPDKALIEVRKAWHGRTLTNELTNRTLARYRSKLTQTDHRLRADFLLWTYQTTPASRLKSSLSSDWRALTDARIRLIRRSRGVDGAIDAVPAALKDHPGLLFDRAVWRRKSRMTNSVSELLVQIDGNDVPPAGRSRLWKERNLAMRSALKAGDWTLAYQLSAPHGMSAGQDFAEAEWNAGWIALRHQGDEARALQHFEKLKTGVGTPISLSRADYWIGRAYEAMNDADAAKAAYIEAAKYNFTYYGQLAAEKALTIEIALPTQYVITEADRTAFDNRSMVRAMRLFAENGWDASFRKFAYHLDDQLSKPQDFELLAELGQEYHYADIGVRGAKAGLAKGVVAADAAYPLVDYTLMRQPQVERSLMLALSRQESEMNPNAISHANARGLMQFIPRTASAEARKQGLPFRTSWLTDDPGYNMTLGGAHLDTLLRQFNGSYIMTTAAYNAGASRPKQWVEDYGDPRAGEVDPVDWVEFIPFSETRNYVQRVLENTQVYRHRLSGDPEPVRLSDDLQRGRFR